MTENIDVFEEVIKRRHYLENLSKNQLKTSQKFDKYNELKHLTITTRDNELSAVLRLGMATKKDYEDMTKEDVNAWLNREISAYSRVTYQLYLGKFFKWMGRDCKNWFVKIENAYNKVIDPSDLWSPEEIHALINAYPEVFWNNRGLKLEFSN